MVDKDEKENRHCSQSIYFSNKKFKDRIFSLLYVNNVAYIYVYIYVYVYIYIYTNLILTPSRALCVMPDKCLYIILLKEFDKVNLNLILNGYYREKLKKRR